MPCKFPVTLGISLLLMSACSAQSIDREENIYATARAVPRLAENGGNLSNEDRKQPPDSNDKQPPSAVPMPRLPDPNTPPSVQPAPPPRPCEGIPAGLKVDSTVQEFLGCKIIQVLANPDRVQTFRVKPEPNSAIPDREKLGEFPIEPQGQGPDLSKEQLRNFLSLVFFEKSHLFSVEKRCKFRPDTGLHFMKGAESVEVLLSFDCELWLFVYKNDQKLEDFDPVQKSLLNLRNALFPRGNTPPNPNPQPPTQP